MRIYPSHRREVKDAKPHTGQGVKFVDAAQAPKAMDMAKAKMRAYQAQATRIAFICSGNLRPAHPNEEERYAMEAYQEAVEANHRASA